MDTMISDKNWRETVGIDLILFRTVNKFASVLVIYYLSDGSHYWSDKPFYQILAVKIWVGLSLKRYCLLLIKKNKIVLLKDLKLIVNFCILF